MKSPVFIRSVKLPYPRTAPFGGLTAAGTPGVLATGGTAARALVWQCYRDRAAVQPAFVRDRDRFAGCGRPSITTRPVRLIPGTVRSSRLLHPGWKPRQGRSPSNVVPVPGSVTPAAAAAASVAAGIPAVLPVVVVANTEYDVPGMAPARSKHAIRIGASGQNDHIRARFLWNCDHRGRTGLPGCSIDDNAANVPYAYFPAPIGCRPRLSSGRVEPRQFVICSGP